jgi:hypothetical protein
MLPRLIKAAPPRGAAGPATAPGSALRTPARRTPGHPMRDTQIKRLTQHAATGCSAAVYLGFPLVQLAGCRIHGASGRYQAIGYASHGTGGPLPGILAPASREAYQAPRAG